MEKLQSHHLITLLKPKSLAVDRIFVLVLTVLISALIYNAIYNYLFHPLAHIPGPFLAKFTRLHRMRYYLRGQEHLENQRLHAKYGPLVRKAPNLLIFSDATMIPEMYSRYVDKSDYYLIYEYFGIVGVRSSSEHAALRRKLSAPFTGTAVHKMKPLIEARVEHWISKLGTAYADTALALKFDDIAQYFAFDVITELTFGKPLGFVENLQDCYGLIETINGHLFIQGMLSRLPWLARGARALNPMGWGEPTPKDKSGLGRIMRVAEEQLEERLSNPHSSANQRGDILEHMVETLKTGALSVSEVRRNLLIFMAAGSDTTALTLNCHILHALHTPGAVDLIRSSPAYAAAAIKETLRISPVATGEDFPRLVPAPGISFPDGTFISPGVEFFASPWVTNRDKTVFGADADVWRPERWLDADDAQKAQMDRLLLTFGAGSRVCIGRAIAEIELEVSLRRFWEVFDVELVDKERGYEKCQNYGMLHYSGIWMRLKRRASS
ncbi:cytochrome P450 [Geopyxis carbonaria]|nr:cytochrome P450 [Geopyxis carbonaria]